jgi:HlyD family secretion protein
MSTVPGVVMSSSSNGLTNGKAAKKRRRRIIIASIVALILVGGGYGVYAALRPNHEIDPSKLGVAERGDLAKVVVATGKIQPLSKVEVKSKASGIVKKLYVDYGDHVKVGQLLAELDKVQLEASLRAAQANYQAAQAAKDSA